VQEEDKSVQISQEEYRKEFSCGKAKNALENALEIRTFEIDLYWKRSAYFWTFIAGTFAGYGALQASSSPAKTDLSVYLSCLGLVFSFGWFCANKGSKQWQENWENHVDMLEDAENGPLYKTVLTRPEEDGAVDYVRRLITGPAALSVSRINQIISLFVTVLWVQLLITTLPPFSREARINWAYVIIIALTALTCVGFLTFGQTHMGTNRPIATRRKTEITPALRRPL
jgi:hypothetical protein